MTPQEFKAWFELFADTMSGELPTAVQWQEIRKRVKLLTSGAVPDWAKSYQASLQEQTNAYNKPPDAA